MTDFYISDTHFDHANIIRLCNRPFAGVDEMNAEMVRRWNGAVFAKDTVHFLGDFAWKRHSYWMNQLAGNIIYYRGNHDGELCCHETYKEIRDGDFKLVLFHYPIAAWNGFHNGTFHFYGHVHGQKMEHMPLDWRARAFDVGVETLDYTPRTAEEIIMKGNR